MSIKRIRLALAIWPLAVWGQTPVISKVVNAASYGTGTGATVTAGAFEVLGSGSIATVFGTNLASATAVAASVPLPRRLAGTSVSVYGVAAPLFYVSPTQINFQWPADSTPAGVSSAQGVVVATASGLSDPYTLAQGGGIDFNAVGIFTQNATGCGPGAVLNVAVDGSVSLNSPTNSAMPGSYITAYGTGLSLVQNEPPDGAPASINPLSPVYSGGGGAGPVFDFSPVYAPDSAGWEGRAPGYVGLDQFNVQVPTTVRVGCAVPMPFAGVSNISEPVTISIANGGGTCVDPPTQGYGEITWERTVTTDPNAATEVTETDTVTVSLQASPGRQAPTPPPYAEAYAETSGPGLPGLLPQHHAYSGPSCPIPGYRSLGAGTVTATGPRSAPVQASSGPLQGGTVIDGQLLGGYNPISQVQSGQVTGLTLYQATLPNGAIQPGSFTVSASGGADVGAFQSTVQIGSPIQIQEGWAGRFLQDGVPALITWTGGDPNTWVTAKLTAQNQSDPYDSYPYMWIVPATAGVLTIGTDNLYMQYGQTDIQLIIEVVPDPSQTPAFSAPGLTLGGQTLWKYTYRFEGLTVVPSSTPPTQ